MLAAELEMRGYVQMCFDTEQTGLATHILMVIYILHPPCCLASHSFSLCFHSPWLTPLFGRYLALPYLGLYMGDDCQE